MPVAAVTRQSRRLDAKHGADFAGAYFSDQALKAGALHQPRPCASQVVVDHEDVPKAELARLVGQAGRVPVVRPEEVPPAHDRATPGSVAGWRTSDVMACLSSCGGDSTEALSQEEEFCKLVRKSRSSLSASMAIAGFPKENWPHSGLNIHRGREQRV